MTHYIDNTSIENNLTFSNQAATPTPTTTTLNGTLTLTNASTFTHIFRGTATGYSIKLPNATTLVKGWRFDFFNETSVSFNILYNDNSLFASVLPSSRYALILEDNSTTNGMWIRWATLTGGTASGILHYDASSSTPYTLSTGTDDTLITGMTLTPAAGEYAIWYQGSIEITGNNTVVRTTIYKTGVLVGESLRTIRSSVSTFFTTHITSAIVTFNGTDTLEIRVARNTNTLTIQSRTAIMIRLGDGV